MSDSPGRHGSKEPNISVGITTAKKIFHFRLTGTFTSLPKATLSSGRYTACLGEGGISVIDDSGRVILQQPSIALSPQVPERSCFGLARVPVGEGFHWEYTQDLSFRGELRIRPFPPEGLQVINTLPLEAYLCSVVGSEMSAAAPLEFLKAHAVISRSWAIRRITGKDRPADPPPPTRRPAPDGEIFSWTGAEIHETFDVCADDHCQRYRGILRETASVLEKAVRETRGQILTYGGEICDTRYSKCCGGMTEDFNSVWEDLDIPYLRSLPDNESPARGFSFPLSVEENARRWITGSPEAYCRTTDRGIIETVLPPSDRETGDFFRWERLYSQDELSLILGEKTGRDLGQIRDLLPLQRGGSGRIIRLRVVGTRSTLDVGKELEIRRVLSPTHLYSSAFFVEKEATPGGVPKRFRLLGAGWGHGVGLCQIGAAVMAIHGKTYGEILRHYFPNTRLDRAYDR
ncbi:MAG: SpoIID/LytB domain-containing protein [Deltaproteobacteria bacterium]|nr:SpoIID/LytB domain-containing protein [Deltaproteobacteria bacterium]MBW2123452.1 SpoIID/LytB domain-containing protein [Deltaproteobacteria bacterium]